MRSFFSWYGEATGTLRAAARLKRAADREAGRRDPVEALSIDWDAWEAANGESADQSDQSDRQSDQRGDQNAQRDGQDKPDQA